MIENLEFQAEMDRRVDVFRAFCREAKQADDTGTELWYDTTQCPVHFMFWARGENEPSVRRLTEAALDVLSYDNLTYVRAEPQVSVNHAFSGTVAKYSGSVRFTVTPEKGERIMPTRRWFLTDPLPPMMYVSEGQ